ncbi:putative F-box domain-containing protein [Medicago truncatula]|uniref:F-box protein interaction domain protein n=1 Tax=Medicago truncatula TaxID=3880 RepID=G7JJH9_MEDTR|nr:F-box/kelch-repeat protein At3g23880 [Medicago truncatula]AES87525.1 F-box protein interaction domain protein [Medicago truncatula]KEH29191.1 F-box protein interaction domain protein [Medicago truncatula]RHN59386.1 putative F-box domain-containing protein [Medicago truncatula]
MESVAAKKRKVSTTYIPDEIAFSILSKLPFKSIKRFECIRKAWSLLSENPHFMNMFYKNLLSNSHQCPYYDGGSLLLRDFELGKDVFYSISGERFENKVQLDFSNAYADRFKFRIFGFGSINGTFCLYQDYYYGKTLLWNPSAHAIKLVPSQDELVESSIEDVVDFVSIHDTYYLHGFGYDNLRNDYKVICHVTITGEHAGYGCMSLDPIWVIYSLRTNSWRILDVSSMPCSLARIDGTQVYMDGVCHWLAEEVDDTLEGPCVVSFYLSNEEFFITYIPSYLDDCFNLHTLWINLAVLNGSIALISYHEETTNFHISILGEYGIKESWTKLFMVGPLSCIERPIGVGTKGEIFVIRQDKELVCLDLSTQMIVELAYKEVNSIDRIVMYKETFFQLEE